MARKALEAFEVGEFKVAIGRAMPKGGALGVVAKRRLSRRLRSYH